MPRKYLLICLLTLLPVNAGAQDVAGAWHINLVMPTSNLALTFYLDVADDLLSGRVAAGDSAVGGLLYITNGTVDGNNLTFDLTFELGIQGRPVPTISYQGSVNGDTMNLEGVSDTLPLDGSAGAWQALTLTRRE